MVDTYTKVVLTVIAAALLGLVIQNAVNPARAQFDGCGSIASPCFVSTVDFPVRVVGPVDTLRPK